MINDEGESVTTPALGWETFCQPDRNMIFRALCNLPELFVRLHQELSVKAAGTEHITMSRTAPVPVNLAADALMREVLSVLTSWDEAVRMDAGLTLVDTELSRRRRDGFVVTAVDKTLRAHFGRLLDLTADAMSRSYSIDGDLGKIPEGCHGRTNLIGGYAEVTVELSGVDAAEEILRLERRCRAFLGETRMRERLDVPCPDPSCESFSLERVQGSNYGAECNQCGRLLLASELATWARIFTAGLTLADIPEDVTGDERERVVRMLDERTMKVVPMFAEMPAA